MGREAEGDRDVDTGLSLAGIAMLAAALAAGGVVTGFLAGLFGIGGGGVLVPVLYEVFRLIGVDDAIRMHLAVGTSLAVIVPTTLRSFTAHRARGGVDMDVVKRLAVPIFAGVVVGTVVASASHSSVFKWIWVIVAPIMAAKFFFGRESWRLGADVPKSWWLEVYGVAVGFVSTLMSIGGGAFVTTMLTLYGRSIQQGIGTASGIGPMIAIPGAIGFIWAGYGHPALPAGSLGFVSLIGAAAIIPTSVLAAPWGARVAHGLSRRSLEIAFGCFLMVVALRFLASLVFG